MFDTVTEKFGGFVASEATTEESYDKVSTDNTYIHSTYNPSVNNIMGVRGGTVDLLTSDFTEYDILDAYLLDPYTRPSLSTIEQPPSSSKVVSIDGTQYTLLLDLPMVRTFTNTIGPVTCDDY